MTTFEQIELTRCPKNGTIGDLLNYYVCFVMIGIIPRLDKGT